MKRIYLFLALGLAFLCTYVVGWVCLTPLSAAHGSGRVGGVPDSPPDQGPLLISKIAYPDPFVAPAGNYKVTIHNVGPVTLTDVVIADKIPTGARAYDCGGVYCYYSGGTYYWKVISMRPGGKRTVWFTIGVNELAQVVNEEYSVSAPDAGLVYGDPVLTKVVTPTPTPDPYPPPVETPVPPTPPAEERPLPTPTPPGEPHLVITQTVSPETAGPGEEVLQRVVVTNDGTGGAQNVVLAVQVPAGLEVQEVSISPDAASEWTGNTLWVAWGYLGAGDSASVEVRAVVRSGAVGDEGAAVSIPDYGLEQPSAVVIQPQVLPAGGTAPFLWWGLVVLGGALLVGGLLLWQSKRRNGRGCTAPRED